MTKARKIIWGALGAALAVYFVVALPPVKGFIGRSSPFVASLFSPGLFNFRHVYNSGDVLDFRVGMPKAEFFDVLSLRYAGSADLTINCTVTTAASVVPITPELDIATVYGGGSRLCARLDSDRLGIEAAFEGDIVSAITIWYVNIETP